MSSKIQSSLSPSCFELQRPFKFIIIIIVVVIVNQCSTSELETTTLDATDIIPCDPCAKDDDGFCWNGSLCCLESGKLTCRCAEGYTGMKCDEDIIAESKTRRFYFAFLTQSISLLLILLIFVILLLVVFCVYKKSKQPKGLLLKDSTENLNKELLFVRDELQKLSPAERKSNITRISKMIEATARVTLISYPGLMGVQKPRVDSNFLASSKPKNLAESRNFSAPSALCLTGKSENVKNVKIEKPGGMSVRFAKPSMRKFFSSD